MKVLHLDFDGSRVLAASKNKIKFWNKADRWADVSMSCCFCGFHLVFKITMFSFDNCDTYIFDVNTSVTLLQRVGEDSQDRVYIRLLPGEYQTRLRGIATT